MLVNKADGAEHDLTAASEVIDAVLNSAELNVLLPAEVFDKVMGLTAPQLRHLAITLLVIVRKYSYLWHASLKPRHTRLVNELIEFREHAKRFGYDLWPELDGR